MHMGERAKYNSAEQEELCPNTENTAGCQQISTPVLQPFRSVCLQSGRGGYWLLHMAGMGQAFVRCGRRRLFLICPSQVSEFWPFLQLESGASFSSKEKELISLFHVPRFEFLRCKSQVLVTLGQGTTAQIMLRSRKYASRNICRLKEIISWLNPST